MRLRQGIPVYCQSKHESYRMNTGRSHPVRPPPAGMHPVSRDINATLYPVYTVPEELFAPTRLQELLPRGFIARSRYSAWRGQSQSSPTASSSIFRAIVEICPSTQVRSKGSSFGERAIERNNIVP